MALPISTSLMFHTIKSPSLKEKFIKKRFTDYNLLDYLSINNRKCPNDQLRDIDLIRLHTPLKEEIELLNISDYRMNLHIKNDILYLCGGLVGVRFNNDDLILILNTIKNLNVLWNQLDLYYKSMNSISKKMIIQDNSQLISKDNVNNIESQELYNNQQSLLQFQLLYDNYLQELIIVQDIIKKKQNEIHINDGHHDSLKIDADPESRIGMKMPLWLTTLITKYNLFITSIDNSSNNNSVTMNINDNDKLKLNLGEFSIYLSTLVVTNTSMQSIEHIHCNSDEKEAISILIQASNDCILSLSNSDMYKTSSASSSNNITCDKKYWAKRFYTFLSKMTELANTIKDDSKIELL